MNVIIQQQQIDVIESQIRCVLTKFDEKIIEKNYNKIDLANKTVLIISNFDSASEYPSNIAIALLNLANNIKIDYTYFPKQNNNNVNNDEKNVMIDGENVTLDGTQTAINYQTIIDITKLYETLGLFKSHTPVLKLNIYKEKFLKNYKKYNIITFYWNAELQYYKKFFNLLKFFLNNEGILLIWFNNPLIKPRKDSIVNFLNNHFHILEMCDENCKHEKEDMCLIIAHKIKNIMVETGQIIDIDKYIHLTSENSDESGPFLDGDTSSLVYGKFNKNKEYVHYRNVKEGNEENEENITPIYIPTSEGILQREYAIISKDSEKQIIGSFAATTCTIICVRNRKTTYSMLSHVDDNSIYAGLFDDNYFEKFPPNETDVYIVGGDAIKGGKKLLNGILTLLALNLYEVRFIYILLLDKIEVDIIHDENEQEQCNVTRISHAREQGNFGINCLTGETYCFFDINPNYDYVVSYYPITIKKEERMKSCFSLGSYTPNSRFRVRLAFDNKQLQKLHKTSLIDIGAVQKTVAQLNIDLSKKPMIDTFDKSIVKLSKYNLMLFALKNYIGTTEQLQIALKYYEITYNNKTKNLKGGKRTKKIKSNRTKTQKRKPKYYTVLPQISRLFQ